MSDKSLPKTAITYADYGWPVVTGCSKGCEYCYARKMVQRFSKMYRNGFQPDYHSENLSMPLRTAKPGIVFVAPMGDLFDPAISFDQIAEAVEMMKIANHHKYMILTKQAERMAQFFVASTREERDKCEHIWLGVTYDGGDEAESRMGWLQGFDWPHKWLSLEPAPDALNALRYITKTSAKFVAVGAEKSDIPLHRRSSSILGWDGIVLVKFIAIAQSMGCTVHYKHAGKGNPPVNGVVYDGRIA